jgi:hypothetical protein
VARVTGLYSVVGLGDLLRKCLGCHAGYPKVVKVRAQKSDFWKYGIELEAMLSCLIGQLLSRAGYCMYGPTGGEMIRGSRLIFQLGIQLLDCGRLLLWIRL